MFRNVVAALNEALDITMHLKPLTEHFQVVTTLSLQIRVFNRTILKRRTNIISNFICDSTLSDNSKQYLTLQTLEGTDFTDIRPLFPPMMHTICLVYSHSKYFNSAARIIVLMTVSQSEYSP